MSNFTKSIYVFIIVLSSHFSVLGQSNVMDIISNSANHTVLTAALQAQGLDLVLVSPTNRYTVFAPTDAAFSALLQKLGINQQQLLARPDIRDILLYHVLGATVRSSDLSNGGIVTPEGGGNTLKISLFANGDAFVNHAQISTVDLTASNGVVHVTDDVLLPSTTVVDAMLANNLDLLVSSLSSAGLVPTLSNPFEKFTVFGPKNASIVNVVAALDLDEAFLASQDFVDILLYHVLESQVVSTDLENGMVVTPVFGGNTLKVTTVDGVFINQAEVSDADIQADNGVLHVLNGMLLPVETIYDLLGDDFSILKAAVITAGLTPRLSDPLRPQTVFAPSNSAFSELLEILDITADDLLESEELWNILRHHIVAGEVASADLVNGMLVKDIINEINLKVSIFADNSVFINHAQVTNADIEAYNGLVHVVNQVLLPAETVLDIAIDNDFTSLTKAVFAAGLAPDLSNPFVELTVFAPTNQAFNNIANALGITLDQVFELENLDDILLYHVAEGIINSNDLVNGNVTMLNEKEVTIDLTSGVKVNSATVTTPDLEADNGVVHVINEVLVPSTTSINMPKAQVVKVYPNPASSFITVPNNLIHNDFEIIDISGRLVKAGKVTSELVEVQNLNSGLYFIRISNDVLYFGSFVKE
jgi:transforming growth factor-beta-induced protein